MIWLRRLLLLLLAALAVGPLLWLLSTALKGSEENIFSFPPQLWPQSPTLANFGNAWQSAAFPRYLINSSVVALLAVATNILGCSLAAYPLAHMRFRGRAAIFWGILATSMIPFQLTMIPLFVLMVQFQLRNTYVGLVLPYAVSAFGIFLLRQAYLKIAPALLEAAVLDGCAPWQVWWHILLPAVRADLLTLALFTFVGMWGDFLWPLLLLDDPSMYTLPLGVVTLASAFNADWRLIAAGSIIAIAPVIALFIGVQRFVLPSGVNSGLKE